MTSWQQTKTAAGSETEQNLVKNKFTGKRGGATCRWKRTVPQISAVRVQKNLETWINSLSGLVMPPVGHQSTTNNGTPAQPLTPHFASICYWNTAHLSSISNWKRMKVEAEKCLLVRLVWFGDLIWQHVFCKHCKWCLFSENAITISVRLIAAWGGRRHSPGNKVLWPQKQI